MYGLPKNLIELRAMDEMFRKSKGSVGFARWMSGSQRDGILGSIMLKEDADNYKQLSEIDTAYYQTGAGDYDHWMSSNRRKEIVKKLELSSEEVTVESKFEPPRQPFMPPYTYRDLPQLDKLMVDVGMDWEWYRSAFRSGLMAKRDEAAQPTGPKYNVVINDTHPRDPRRGFQIGDGNIQYNNYT